MEADTVDLEALTDIQEDAASGLLAMSMAGYLQWLAPQLVERRSDLLRRVRELRRELEKEHGWHGRTASNVASLMATAEVLGEYLSHAGIPAAPLELKQLK